ncbi:hypothetical protein GH714_037191 [Hevea brasiliensis]|uniref:Uncharacterized protein n=1 Tax=Hevea brasiliensis TaxID=3981 RepID=A0A6A6L4G0_HEVBR|nr:hypothetical protein GH714_037191 [Hevea brasiliensis]
MPTDYAEFELLRVLSLRLRVCAVVPRVNFPFNPTMEVESGSQKDSISCKCSVLLELSASDDLVGFKSEVEEKGLDVDEASYWTCGWDKVTALHCAVAGSSNSLVEIVKLLLDASADANCVDANGNKPSDLLTSSLKSPCNSRRKLVELLLKGESLSEDEEEKLIMMSLPAKEGTEKKEYPIDVSLPDKTMGFMVQMSLECTVLRLSLARGHTPMIGPSAHLSIQGRMQGGETPRSTLTVVSLALSSARGHAKG